MTALITPSPYLRDHLLAALSGLRRDAETARLNLAEAEQDVAAARELLREAEAQERRARNEVDGLARDIAWAEEQAARRTQEIDAAAAAHHAGIVTAHDEPRPPAVSDEPGFRTPPGVSLSAAVIDSGPVSASTEASRWPCPKCGGTLRWVGEHMDEIGHVPTGQEECPAVPPVNIARTPDQVNAALAPPAPAGEVVATAGPGQTGPLDPTQTCPDPGLAHPVPNPPTPLAAEAPKPHSHARPGALSRLTGGWPVVGRRRTDEQDGSD